MQVQRIQKKQYNPQFNGILKVQNYRKSEGIIEKETTIDLDRGLANCALKNLFEGSWSNYGGKQLPGKNIAPYLEALLQTLGINLPKNNEMKYVKLKNFNNGYSIKVNGEYKIIHIRDDYMI